MGTTRGRFGSKSHGGTYGPNTDQVMRLLREWDEFVDRAEDVVSALAVVERRSRKGEVTERESAIGRMREIINGNAAIRTAATNLEIEVGNRWTKEFDTFLTEPRTLARSEARRRGGAGALAVYQIEQREKKADRVRKEALLALIARPNLNDADFRLIYRPAAAAVPLGRIDGWGIYGPMTEVVDTILMRLGHMQLDDWVAAVLMRYRLTKQADHDYAAAESAIRYLTISDPYDKRNHEIAAAEDAAAKLLEGIWTPPDTRSWWQKLSGDESQKRLWRWRKKTADEACSLVIQAAVYADRLPQKSFVATLAPFRALADIGETPS